MATMATMMMTATDGTARARVDGLRRAQGLSRNDLAEMLGVASSLVFRWMAGECVIPERWVPLLLGVLGQGSEALPLRRLVEGWDDLDVVLGGAPHMCLDGYLATETHLHGLGFVVHAGRLYGTDDLVTPRHRRPVLTVDEWMQRFEPARRAGRLSELDEARLRRHARGLREFSAQWDAGAATGA